MSSDLKDILVVSIEQAVAAPYLSSRLADAGARVIKIERPEGDFARTSIGKFARRIWRSHRLFDADDKQPIKFFFGH